MHLYVLGERRHDICEGSCEHSSGGMCLRCGCRTDSIYSWARSRRNSIWCCWRRSPDWCRCHSGNAPDENEWRTHDLQGIPERPANRCRYWYFHWRHRCSRCQCDDKYSIEGWNSDVSARCRQTRLPCCSGCGVRCYCKHNTSSSIGKESLAR